jgi:hypothetical protein
MPSVVLNLHTITELVSFSNKEHMQWQLKLGHPRLYKNNSKISVLKTFLKRCSFELQELCTVFLFYSVISLIFVLRIAKEIKNLGTKAFRHSSSRR